MRRATWGSDILFRPGGGVRAACPRPDSLELIPRPLARREQALPGVGLARLALVCLALGGCKLIDQTTFAPAPEARPVPQTQAQAGVSLRVDPRTPLAVIDFSTAEPAYHGPLAYAVRAAEARDRNVQFDVVAVTRSADDPATAQGHAVDVMRTMMTERIPATRLHLGFQTDPATPANQVRVYVR